MVGRIGNCSFAGWPVIQIAQKKISDDKDNKELFIPALSKKTIS